MAVQSQLLRPAGQQPLAQLSKTSRDPAERPEREPRNEDGAQLSAPSFRLQQFSGPASPDPLLCQAPATIDLRIF